jgi:hypothetical protein
MEWEREANVIAERFKKGEIPGFLTKEFTAKDNEFVVVEKGKEIYRERGPGRFTISGFVGDLTDILLVDKSEKTLESEIKNVWLSDEKNIDIKFVVKFRIFHSDHFSKNLMGERKKFFLDDLRDEILSKVMYRDVLPELQKNPASRFLKEDFREGAKENIESRMKKDFKEWGLILSSLSIDFKIPEGLETEKTEPEKSEVKEEGKEIEKTEEEEPTEIKKYKTEMTEEEES